MQVDKSGLLEEEEKRHILDWTNHPQIPTILSHLTIVELLLYQRVSKRWRKVIKSTFKHTLSWLNLSQFWCSLGVVDSSVILGVVSSFSCVSQLCLSFCHFLTDDLLINIVDTLKDNGCNLTSCDLFYCYQLTDDSIDRLIQNFPHTLHFLNLARCSNLTDRTTKAAAMNMTNLIFLNLSYIPNLSEASFRYIGVMSDSLLCIDLSYCTQLDNSKNNGILNDIRDRRPKLIVIGPSPLSEEDYANIKNSLPYEISRFLK